MSCEKEKKKGVGGGGDSMFKVKVTRHFKPKSLKRQDQKIK